MHSMPNSKVIPEGFGRRRQPRSDNKTWKLDRPRRALTASSTRMCLPRHQRHCRCTSLILHLYLPASSICRTATMDTSQTPHWQRLLYWTAFWNTLCYLLTREPTSTRTRYRIALGMGCYSHAYALLDEARKQQCVSFASIVISAIAVGHMVWMYCQRRHTR
jgi:hypothetical protein